MTKGNITITFDGGLTTTVGIEINGNAQELELSNVWYDLKHWFTHSRDTYHVMRAADGSVVMLNRDKILNIALTPMTCLEIN